MIKKSKSLKKLAKLTYNERKHNMGDKEGQVKKLLTVKNVLEGGVSKEARLLEKYGWSLRLNSKEAQAFVRETLFRFNYEIRFNSMKQRIEHRKKSDERENAWEQMTETSSLSKEWVDLSEFYHIYKERKLLIDFDFHIRLIASDNKKDPVIERLNEVMKKAVDDEALDKLLGELTPNKEHQELIYLWMQNVCWCKLKRAQPICLIFQGKQGSGKSSIAQRLASLMGYEYYTDKLLEMSKDDQLSLVGTFIWNFDEIERCLTSQSLPFFKNLITQKYTSFRPPYGKHVEAFECECSFLGSTNKETFLHDTTGERRFLIAYDFRISEGFFEDMDLQKEVIETIWGTAYKKVLKQQYSQNNEHIEKLNDEIKKLQEANAHFREEQDIEQFTLSYFEYTGDKLDTLTIEQVREHMKNAHQSLLVNSVIKELKRVLCDGKEPKNVKIKGAQARRFQGVRLRRAETGGDIDFGF